MEQLDESCAARIAQLLTDERDLAALCLTSRFWRGVLAPDNSRLWLALLGQRFGSAAAAAAATVAGLSRPTTAAGPSAPAAAAPDPATRFRQLASLIQPAARLETITWLNGHYLAEVADASSTFGTVVKLREVCWLELAGHLHGVLPGRYRVAWRIRLENYGWLDRADLVARQEPATAGEDGGAAQQQQGTVSSTPLVWDTLSALSEQAGQDWFVILGHPFDVAQLSSVHVRFEALSGAWKRGIVFDSVSLIREPPQRGLQATPPQQQGAGLAEQAAEAIGWLVQSINGLLGS